MGAALVLSFATSAQAVIIDLDSTTPGPNDINNPITLAGLDTSDTVNITQIGMADGGSYDAWNPWGFVAGCGRVGEDCTNGWVSN